MIQAKLNPSAPLLGLQLGDQEAGCCVTATSECLYKFVFATTPASFTVITVGGVAKTFVHTYTTPLAFAVALKTALGVAGYVVEDNDIKAYIDPFGATANRLTVEIKSGIAITNFINNVGTITPTTTKCTKQTMSRHILDYTLSAAIDLTINNVDIPLTTYATVALLRTALNSGLTLPTAYARVRAGAAGHAEIWLYVKTGYPVYYNAVLSLPDSSELIYV